MTPADIVGEVTKSGLRGRGGAGFPTGIKWNTVLGAKADQKYIVCNADEGDSGTFADRMIMEGDPFTLIEGMIIAALAVEATKGYVYLRSEYPDAIDIMNKAVVLARNVGLLGVDVLGSGRSFEMEIRVGAGAYVCGEETSFLNSLEGKRGVVCAKPLLPALEGFLGKPTVVNNVISLATVPVVMENRMRQGAKLIVIDPRRTDIVRSAHVEASYHLPLLTGTNVAVLSSIAHVIVTESLMDEDFIRTRCDWDEFAHYAEFISDPRHSPEATAMLTGVDANELRAAAKLVATDGN
jgi:hypothetical protein